MREDKKKKIRDNKEHTKIYCKYLAPKFHICNSSVKLMYSNLVTTSMCSMEQIKSC